MNELVVPFPIIFCLFLVLATVNFMFQFYNEHKWNVAMESSFDQFLSLFALWVLSKL